MTLTDLMSGAGLATYAEAALVLFLVSFVVLAARIYSPSARAEMEASGRLPLDDPNDRLVRAPSRARPE
jgi:cbb3-type cytochrome oxidase subunit 3